VSPGRHASPDGSFGRSASGAAFRGALLIGAAVLIGVLLLNANDDDPFSAGANGAEDATTTTTTTAAPAPVEPRPAAEVEVLVANGSDIKGAAGGFSARLAELGYNVLPATDTSVKPAPAAVIYYAVGFEVEARAIAAQVGLEEGAVQPMPDPPPVADLAAAEVLVVLDAARAQAGPPPPA
jgi:hypothetical protein